MINTLNEFEKISIQQSNREFWLNVILAIITFISVFLFYLDYRNRKNKERAEKSINIAENFAKSIIYKFSIIFQSFESANLSNIINKVKFINFVDFDVDELNELYSKEDIEKYRKILYSKENFIPVDNKSICLRDFIVLTLNELEHICMYIVTKIADDKYIYNSLHQQFFKAISVLYISIALINTDNKDKYYTNIIEVFNLWKNKYIKIAKKEKRLRKKLNPKNPKI